MISFKFKKDALCFLAITRSFFKDKDFLKHFGFIFGLYFIGYFGFLTSDFLHVDDNVRILLQKPLFSRDGRFLSEILSYLFHTSYPHINNNAPINQLIAIIFLSLASMALVKIVNKKISYFGLVASLVVGLSPFYLDCMAFKYDSPYMALATLCAILPFLFIRRLSLFFIVSVIFLLCMWNTYQTNNGIYIVLAMFITLNLFLQNANLEQIYKFIFSSIFAFVISGVIYKFAFMPFRPQYEYIDKMVEAISFSDIWNKIILFIPNIENFIEDALIVQLFLAVCVLFAITKISQIKAKSYIFSIFFIVMFLVVGFYATHGMLFVISGLNFIINPRNFIGIGAFMAILLIDMLNSKSKFINLSFKAISIITAYHLIVFSTTHINTLNMYKKYIDFRISQVYAFLQNSEKYSDYEIKLANLNLLGVTKPLALALEYSTLAANHINAFYFFSENYYKTFDANEYINFDKECSGEIKESIETKFNKFKIYDKCVLVLFKHGKPFIYDSNFRKSITEGVPLIQNRKLNEDLEFWFYPTAKISFATNMSFGFNDAILNQLSKGSDMVEFSLYFKDKDGFLRVAKNIKDFSKVSNRYFYSIGVGNVALSEISHFNIKFYNEKSGKISDNFIVKWRDDL